MRKLLGLCVMLAGLVALGWFATATTAPRIEASLGLRASLIAQGAPQPLATVVSGRDVMVRGTVEDPDDFARIVARFAGIEGVRKVDLAGLATLPTLTPYEARIVKREDGTVTMTGAVPSTSARTTLEVAVAAQDIGALQLAAGAPEGWTDAMLALVAALEDTISADVALTNTAARGGILVRTPAERDALRDRLAALPTGYTMDARIEVIDDGVPMSLALTLAEGDVSGRGKLPADMAVDSVRGLLPDDTQLDLVQARLPQPVNGWSDAVRTAVSALAGLTEAELSIEGTVISLDGAGAPESVAAARSALSALPDDFETRVDLRLYDDGVPLSLSVDRTGPGATVAGKLPAGYNLPDLGIAPDTTAIVRSNLPDDDGSFTRNANLGVEALSLLDAGEMTATAEAIVLTGTATSPRVGTAIDDLLATAATTDITRDIAYLDDGSPASWVLRYDATSGALVEGRLPQGLSRDDLSEALGLSLDGNPATAAEDTEVGAALDALAVVSTVLPNTETLTYTREGGAAALDLVVSPGNDLDQIATDLALRLPPDVGFEIALSPQSPEAGTRRINAATGAEEVFEGGVWRPDLDFDVDLAGCRAEADAILADTGLVFLSGSDRLDAASVRGVNSLAAVVEPCVAAGLSLEIGGHTDSSGSVAANEALSFARATAVLAALTERGVPEAAMSAVGFGDSRPIADNDTPEGRAANRRTTLTWADPDAP